MKISRSEIAPLVNDLVSERFDEVDDLCRFIQNRLGKMDVEKSSQYFPEYESELLQILN